MLRSAIQDFLEHPLQWKDDELSKLPRDTAKAIPDQARVDEPCPVIRYLLDQLEHGDP